MDIISKEDIVELAGIHSVCCISIFINTHKAGQEVLEQKDILTLKNQLKEVETELKKHELTQKEINELTLPVWELMEDKDFWRHQQGGLALFLTMTSRGNYFKRYILPVELEPDNYLSSEFYLKPLIPVYQRNASFYLLTLELEKVRLYKCTLYTIKKVEIGDIIPSKLEEVVGYDHEQKSLQFRNEEQQKDNAFFHGHGEGKDDEQSEIRKFFSAVNNGLMSVFHDKSTPILVVCPKHLFPIYKEVNTYSGLLSDFIPKNPESMKMEELHGKAIDIMLPYFDKKQKVKLELFNQYYGTKKASTEIEEIIPAAIDGKIDTLFLQKGEDLYGIYNSKTNDVKVYTKHIWPNVSLTNMAAIKVALSGGNVYLLEKSEMPDSYSIVNALYRY